QRDLTGSAAQQPGEHGVGVADLVRGLVGGLIPTGQRLMLQVTGDRLGYLAGWQRGPGVVEVDHLGAAWGVGPGLGYVERHGGSVRGPRSSGTGGARRLR